MPPAVTEPPLAGGTHKGTGMGPCCGDTARNSGDQEGFLEETISEGWQRWAQGGERVSHSRCTMWKQEEVHLRRPRNSVWPRNELEEH